MTTPRDRAKQLIAVATNPTTATEEARTAAMVACKLIAQHDLLSKVPDGTNFKVKFGVEGADRVRESFVDIERQVAEALRRMREEEQRRAQPPKPPKPPKPSTPPISTVANIPLEELLRTAAVFKRRA